MYTILVCIGLIWLLIMFFDTIFKTCMFRPYYKTLHRSSLHIKPFIIYWRTTRFNRYINRMGCYKPLLQKYWFNVGAVVTCVIMFPCLSLYVIKLTSMFQTVTPEEFESSKLVPVIPGFNFPLSYWRLYGCVIFVCSFFHEAGHALAASRLRVGVDNWGFAVCLVAPIAFVSLRLDQLSNYSKWQQMTIFCAGIWHNIVLSLGSLLSLEYFVLLSSPFFYVGQGVTVLQIHELSGLSTPGGFIAGDHIYGIGKCMVKDLDTWNACLHEFEEKSQGLCVPRHLLLNNSTSATIEECVKKSENIYFHTGTKQHKAGVCLRARTATENYSFCTQSSECEEFSLCVSPHLAEYDRFLVIHRYGKSDVLYVGSINELKADVMLSEFLPKFTYISPSIAETIKEFLEYVLIFSNGLACLNVLPIFSLDGNYITENLIHIFLLNYFSFEQRKYFSKCISMFTLGVICLLTVVTLYKMSVFYL